MNRNIFARNIPVMRSKTKRCRLAFKRSFANLPRNINSESARRRPDRLDESEIERVELRPENVALVAQCLDGALLLPARSGVIKHVLKREGSVFRCLGEPRFKVIEPGSQPRIVLTQFLHPQRDQVPRKKLGQRRSDALV